MSAEDHPPSLRDLGHYERKIHSQNGEDGVLLRLLAVLPDVPKVAVEIGVWHGPGAEVGGDECNTRILCEYDDWRVHQFDASAPIDHPRIRRAWVTVDNVDTLLDEAGIGPDFGVFSLDIDGVDYWIWRALATHRPAVVIVEYNAALGGLDLCVTIPYDPDYRWDFSGRCGANLGAHVRLAHEKGYRLVHCTAPNAFFVARERCEGFELDDELTILARQWGPRQPPPPPHWSLVDVRDPAHPVPWEPRNIRPLEDIRVLDLSTLYAGPLAAMLLADFGAKVLKIEHPSGDPIRRVGPSKLDDEGRPVGLAAKLLNRNKYCATLDLSKPEGQALLLELVDRADVLVENFRPGTLERWQLAPERLLARNPRLIIARVTGFGQHGPHSARPGFGTLAEALSGFAALSGPPEGPPQLPAFPLADSVAGLAAAFAVTTALQARTQTGRGQVVDLAIIEPLLTILGPQLTWVQQLGHVPQRSGSRSTHAAPRNVYRTRDGRWVAVSATSPKIAARLMTLLGREDLCAEPWFATGAGRLEHEAELDHAVADWLARHDFADADAAFAKAEAALAPVLDVSEIAEHPQYRALGSVVELGDPQLGPIAMQNLMFRLSETPGKLCWAGPELGAHNQLVYGELLGRSEAELDGLRQRGII